MKMFNISSSMISKIGFDETQSELVVVFTNGDEWKYSKVPKSEYENLLNSSSAGSYFAKNIKSKYTGKKM